MSLHNSDEIEKPEMDFLRMLVGRNTTKPNKSPAKRVLIGEEEERNE